MFTAYIMLRKHHSIDEKISYLVQVGWAYEYPGNAGRKKKRNEIPVVIGIVTITKTRINLQDQS